MYVFQRNCLLDYDVAFCNQNGAQYSLQELLDHTNLFLVVSITTMHNLQTQTRSGA